MHGAIVADALRIPWVPARPIQVQHHRKWFDWADALQLDLRPRPLAPSNGLEAAMSLLRGSRKTAERLRRRGQLLKSFAAPVFFDTAASSLRRLAGTVPTLSRDSAIESAHGRMLEKLETLHRSQESVLHGH